MEHGVGTSVLLKLLDGNTGHTANTCRQFFRPRTLEHPAGRRHLDGVAAADVMADASPQRRKDAKSFFLRRSSLRLGALAVRQKRYVTSGRSLEPL